LTHYPFTVFFLCVDIVSTQTTHTVNNHLESASPKLRTQLSQ
jgi:hypothetical protein